MRTLGKRVIWLCVLGLIFGGGFSFAGEEKSPGEELQQIKSEFESARKNFEKAYEAAKTDEERQKASELYPQGPKYAPRVLAVAKKAEGTPVELEALLWVLDQAYYDQTIATHAVDILLRRYAESKEIAPAIRRMTYSQATNTETFLRKVIEKNPNQNVKGAATFTLACYLKDNHGAQHTNNPKEAEELFEKVISDYSGKQDPGTDAEDLATQAKKQLYELRNLAIGKVAPEIEGEDVEGKKFKLSDHRGKIVVLDFWGDW
jgi:hypothetical protein